MMLANGRRGTESQTFYVKLSNKICKKLFEPHLVTAWMMKNDEDYYLPGTIL